MVLDGEFDPPPSPPALISETALLRRERRFAVPLRAQPLSSATRRISSSRPTGSEGSTSTMRSGRWKIETYSRSSARRSGPEPRMTTRSWSPMASATTASHCSTGSSTLARRRRPPAPTPPADGHPAPGTLGGRSLRWRGPLTDQGDAVHPGVVGVVGLLVDDVGVSVPDGARDPDVLAVGGSLDS